MDWITIAIAAIAVMVFAGPMAFPLIKQNPLAWLRGAVAVALVGVCVARMARPQEAVPVEPALPAHSEQAVILRKTLGQASASDRKALANLYLAIAKAVSTGKHIHNTQQLAVGTANAIDLAFDGRKLVPGVEVGAQVDAVVAAAIGGAHDVSITDANRESVLKGLREVAWACGAGE